MRVGRSAIITAIATSAAAAAALAFTPAGPAAALNNVTGTGTTTCKTGYTGRFTFSPALTAGGASTHEAVGVELSFGGCSGGSPVPASGSYGPKGVVTGAGASNCAKWFAPSAGTAPGFAVRNFNGAPMDGGVSWSPSTINGSNVRFGSMRIMTGAGTLHDLTFILPNVGTGAVTGSYAPKSHLVLRVDPAQNYPALTAACASGGVSAVNIVPTSPAGSSTGTW